MDRIEAMTTFVMVAELRGFAPAARKLGLSPSAVTRLVAALEDRLQIQLLQRTTRSVALTDAGARYLESTRRILAAIEHAEGTARAERYEPTGRLVVAAPNVFGRREVAPLMCDFMAKYPAVLGELTLADRMLNLVEESIDIAVRIGQLDDSTLKVRNVGKTRRVLVASPAYLADHKRLRTPDDLKSHALIHFNAFSPVPEWRFQREGAELRVPIKPTFITNSADAAIGHALRGGGVAMVLSYQVLDAVREGGLQVVLPKFELPPLPIQLVYPATRLVSANVRAFLELTLSSREWNFVDFANIRAESR